METIIEDMPNIGQAAKFLNLTEEALEAKLKEMGLSHEDLKDDYVFRFGDFKDAFKETPIANVRKAYRELRGGDKKKDDQDGGRAAELKTLFGVKPTLETADVQQLL